MGDGRRGRFARALEWIRGLNVYPFDKRVESDFPWNEYWMKIGERPGWNDYWMKQAADTASRATCLKRGFGAAIVTHGNVLVAQGYNGAPRGAANCLERGYCIRRELGVPHGRMLEMCIGVDAERNAIVNAARNGTAIPANSRMYIFGFDKITGRPISGKPRIISMGEILNAGITEICYLNDHGEFEKQKAIDLLWTLTNDVKCYLGVSDRVAQNFAGEESNT